MPPKKKGLVDIDLSTVQRELTEGLRNQIARPSLYAYKPHEKQMTFHQSVAHSRLYIGGNRSGKTTGGVVEDCYWLMKRHPYRRLPLPEGPVRGRAVAVDFTYGVAVILLPEFKRWLPPSFLINGSWEDSYHRELRTLTLSNGSFIEFKSYDQDLEKFAGTSRHFTHYDEEPPKPIYDECQARLVDTDGYSWLTMTPVEGMSWVFEDLYEPGVNGAKDIEVIEVDTLDNPHISKEAAERYFSTLSEDDRKAREHGKFVQMGGLVYREFNEAMNVVPFYIPPKSWKWYVSIDHGYNNPTAILWHAVSPDNEVVTFDIIYQRETTVDQFAALIHAKTAAFKRAPDHIVGDPAMEQRQAVTGTSILQEYAKHGIYIAKANNDVTSGVDRVNQYLKFDPVLKKPRWTITENCGPLIAEIKKLHWKRWSSKKQQFENNPQEVIHKKDDHACDSARYFFTFLPDLAPQMPTFPNYNIIEQHSGILGAHTPAKIEGRVDPNLSKASKPKWLLSSVGTDMQGYEY